MTFFEGCGPSFREAFPLTCEAALDPLAALLNVAVPGVLGFVLVMAIFAGLRALVRRLFFIPQFMCRDCGQRFYASPTAPEDYSWHRVHIHGDAA